MKRTIIWVIIVIFVLSACSAPSGAEQGGTTNSTTGNTQMASSTTATTNTTVPTTSTVPTTISTDPTTVSTAPTTVTTVPTTASTTQPTTSTKATTNTTKPTTTKPTTNTTKPTTVSTNPTTRDPNVLYEYVGLKVYKSGENYAMSMTSSVRVDYFPYYIGVSRSIEFAPDRSIVRKWSIEPIECDNYQELLNSSMDSIKSMYGDPHALVGSGLASYAYVTVEGYIIFLYAVGNSGVYYVRVIDFIQDEPVLVGEWDNYETEP